MSATEKLFRTRQGRFGVLPALALILAGVITQFLPVRDWAAYAGAGLMLLATPFLIYGLRNGHPDE